MESVPFTPTDLKEAQKACKRFDGKMTNENRFYELCFVLCAPQAKIGNNHIVNNNLRFMDFYNKKPDPQALVETLQVGKV